MNGGDVLRRAEPHFALQVAFTERGNDVVVQPQDPARLRQQAGAFRCDNDTLARPIQKRRPQLVLQSANLKADRGLGSPQQGGRPRKASRFHNGYEGPQEVELEIDQTRRHVISIRYETHQVIKLAWAPRRGHRGSASNGPDKCPTFPPVSPC